MEKLEHSEMRFSYLLVVFWLIFLWQGHYLGPNQWSEDDFSLKMILRTVFPLYPLVLSASYLNLFLIVGFEAHLLMICNWMGSLNISAN